MKETDLIAEANYYETATVKLYDDLLNRTYVKKEAVRDILVSVITVTYNSSSTVKDTLESVRRQSYHNIEHIVVDGLSTDKTVDIVKSFSHVAKCISEKDTGIYDAINKGVKLASGDIIAILNSDDIYAHNNVVAKVVAQFDREKTDTVYGDLYYVDHLNMNRVMRKWVSGEFEPARFKFGWMPPHPSFFVKKEVYKKIGYFNLGLKTSADYEFMLRVLYKNHFTTSYLPDVLVRMRSGGVSNGSIIKRLNAHKEDKKAWKLNKLRPYFFTLYLKPLRKIRQYINKEQMKRVPFIGLFV